MSWLSLVTFVANIFNWLTGREQQKIGRIEQQNDDKDATIKQLEAEKQAAASRPSAVDRLRDENF